jgi:hypothetical protein
MYGSARIDDPLAKVSAASSHRHEASFQEGVAVDENPTCDLRPLFDSNKDAPVVLDEPLASLPTEEPSTSNSGTGDGLEDASTSANDVE